MWEVEVLESLFPQMIDIACVSMLKEVKELANPSEA
jgi:hypothetical protein